MKAVFTTLTLLYILPVFAQQNEEAAIRNCINQFFKGMYEADTAMIRSACTEEVIFQTITNNRNNKVRQESFAGFLQSIASLQKGDADEKIQYQSILIDGDLAHVWTPYEFYYKGRLSHTGVNSFQLVKTGEGWKVVYVIDTRKRN
jgi:ketosteroid isomerase-like protein